MYWFNKKAEKFYRGDVEIIIVCNRCTDRTAKAKERNIPFFAKIYLSIQQENMMTWATGSILN